MQRAYSLIRFSSWKQAGGQSRRRQAEWSAAWCEKNGCALDESLHQDKPVSAFRGANRGKGALAAFLDMANVGRVPRGSILLVESLDRLSREEVDEALTLFLGILKKGVEIVTMVPERHYTKASVGDIVGLLEPIIIMSRAHEESAIKSLRIGDVWTERRKHAAQRPMTGNGPAWLRMVGGRWQVDEAKADAIRRVYALTVEGFGLHAICAKLNAEKVQPIGRSKEWVVSYVFRCLRNRAVLGEGQPHVIRDGKRRPIGPALATYYPPIISEAVFHQAAAALASRKNQKGPRGKHVRNLFTGLLRDATDGCTLVTVTESDKCRSVRLVSSGSQRGKEGSTYRTFPYPHLEAAFLRLVKELKASDVLPTGEQAGVDEAAALAGRLRELDHRIGKTMADLKAHGDFDSGMQLLRDLEAEKKEASAALEKVQAEASTGGAEVLGEAQSLIDLMAEAEGDELVDLRTRIKARVAELVSEMRMLIVVREGCRLAALQIWFGKDRGHRVLLIRSRPGNRQEPGSWLAKSYDEAAPGKADLDLRRPAHARQMEKTLLVLDLNRIFPK